VLQAITDCTS